MGQNASTTPEKVDVLICGSGSAGVCAAAWLARCGIKCKILESQAGPLHVGKADGVQCRTVEVFESFGLEDHLLRESYHVLEVSFWRSDTDGKLTLTKRTADTAPGLSHLPHVILNQARVNGILIDAMRKWNGQEIDYGYLVKGVELDSKGIVDSESYPVRVTTEKGGKEEIFQAKYVLVGSFCSSFPRTSNLSF
jgi:phenol 2-monooxygenase